MLLRRIRPYPCKKLDRAPSDNMQIDGKKVTSNHIDKNDTPIRYQSTINYHNTVLSKKKAGALELLAIHVNTKLLL